MRRYAELGHVLVAPRGVPRGVVDDRLAEHGLQRRVMRTVASFLVAPHLLVRSDYVLTLPSRLAALLATPLELETRRPPIELPGFDLSMVWHRRHEDDPKHRWLRQRVRELA